jgi:glycosyltransferase involved in cell wall biosynthesis
VLAKAGGPARPLRVMHLVPCLGRGGLERVVLDLVRLANRELVDPSVASLGGKGELIPCLESMGVPVRVLNAGSRTQAVVRLQRVLADLRPDVVHSHNPGPHAVAVLARLFGHVPVLVHTKHGRNHPRRRRAVLENRLASYLTDALVAVSADAAAVATEIEQVRPNKVLVLHNGVDLETYHSSLRDRPSGAAVRGICVANLNPAKDLVTLLRAARRVKDEFAGFTLEIVGEGPSRPELESLQRQLGLGGSVVLLGAREDVPSLLRNSDFFVLSSRTEGLCLSLLEAMACGLPVVATDVGGNREVIADSGGGILVPSGSPELLADAVLSILRRPSVRLQMGRAARSRVERAFDLRTVVSRYEELYMRLWLSQAHVDSGESGAHFPVSPGGGAN